jgi:hypothetical protein
VINKELTNHCNIYVEAATSIQRKAASSDTCTLFRPSISGGQHSWIIGIPSLEPAMRGEQNSDDGGLTCHALR